MVSLESVGEMEMVPVSPGSLSLECIPWAQGFGVWGFRVFGL